MPDKQSHLAVRQLRKKASALLERPLLASAILSLLVLIVVLPLWRLGLFQLWEIELYDLALRLQPRPASTMSRVTIVGMTDDDILKYAWPLNDSRLAKLLERLESFRPRAIGLDLYRDLPEPRIGNEPAEQNGDLLRELESTLTNHANIICIYSVNTDTQGLDPPPPPVLAGMPHRIGLNDFPADDAIRKVVRRGLLFGDVETRTDVGVETNTVPTLGQQLAALYLRHESVDFLPDAKRPGQFRWGKLVYSPFEADDGAYVNADASGYQLLLDFKGPEKFQTFTLTNVFSAHLPPDAFRDKVVLIGVTAKTVNDPINTPLESIRYGVELHAHFIDQLLRATLDGDQPTRSWAEWQEAVWIALWCFVGAWLGSVIRSPLLLLAALAGTAGAIAGSFWLALGAGWWIPVAAPAAAFLPGAALVTSFKSYQEKQRRTVLMHLFSRHVSRDIAETIWSQRTLILEGHRPRPQELVATVLFTDLKGFSTIAERMTPTALIDWTNQYIEQMARTVVAHGGVINKFIGDAVMAVFGIPVPRVTQEEHSRDADNAVRCALAMGRALVELNAQWQAAGLPSASMRVGIFTGPLVAGSVGSSERLEYTVIGDTVNTAARLESFDKEVADPDLLESKCRVLIGESTQLLLHDRYEISLIGSLRLKGKNEKVTIYQVLREAVQTKVTV